MKHYAYTIMSLVLVTINCQSDNTSLALSNREPAQVNHYHWSLWGNYQYRQGKIKPAAYWYARILDDNPTPYALHGYVAALHKSRNYPAIIKLMPSLDTKYADNRDMQLIFAQALLYTKNIIPAHKKFIAIYEKNKTHSESAYFAAESYSRMNKPAQALAAIDTYLKGSSQRHTDFLFHFLKAQIYAGQRNLSQARVHANKALELNPRFEQGMLFLQLLDKIEQETKRSGTHTMNQHAFKKYVPQVQQQSNSFYRTEKAIYFSHL